MVADDVEVSVPVVILAVAEISDELIGFGVGNPLVDDDVIFSVELVMVCCVSVNA